MSVSIPSDQRWSKPFETIKRLRQLIRVISIAEAIRTNGELTYSELGDELRREFGIDVCKRTIRRDTNALAELGFVEIVKVDYKSRGRWIRVLRFTRSDWPLRFAMRHFEEVGSDSIRAARESLDLKLRQQRMAIASRLEATA